jgi:hypothetical protein
MQDLNLDQNIKSDSDLYKNKHCFSLGVTPSMASKSALLWWEAKAPTSIEDCLSHTPLVPESLSSSGMSSKIMSSDTS